MLDRGGVVTEHFQTGLKKPGRGMARASRDLIDAMYDIAKAAQPITGRGVGYKLFTRGLIGSMSVNDMQKVYRLLKIAREEGTIPWAWIVDETGFDLEQYSRVRGICRDILSPRFLGPAAGSCRSLVRERNDSRRIAACVGSLRGRLSSDAWVYERNFG
jgi:hypothetical protein